jgi:Rhodopirellula transposase DDE domain
MMRAQAGEVARLFQPLWGLGAHFSGVSREPSGRSDDRGPPIHLNASHDTSELCCDSVALWWEQAGRAVNPRATRLLVLGDGGGSNSATHYLFKDDLKGLANRLGLEIRVAHYPV